MTCSPHELFDILDEKGNPLGKTMQRAEVHRTGAWHASVHVWIRTPSGLFILQKRSIQKDSWPSYWDVSVAGHIDAGENSMHAVLRECREEAGLNLNAEDFRFVFRYKRDGKTDREFQDIYLCRKSFSPEELRPEASEVDAFCTVDAKEVLKGMRGSKPWIVPHLEEFEKILELPENSSKRDRKANTSLVISLPNHV